MWGFPGWWRNRALLFGSELVMSQKEEEAQGSGEGQGGTWGSPGWSWPFVACLSMLFVSRCFPSRHAHSLPVHANRVCHLCASAACAGCVQSLCGCRTVHNVSDVIASVQVTEAWQRKGSWLPTLGTPSSVTGWSHHTSAPRKCLHFCLLPSESSGLTFAFSSHA